MHKVGVFAGTFDPVHEGHVRLALEAIAQCQLDKVFFLVEPRPRRKQGVKALQHRLAMVQLATKDDARLGTILLEQAQFTVNETLPILQARFKGARLFLIMGDDVAAHLSAWPHLEDLSAAVSLIVAVREHRSKEIEKQLTAIKSIKGLSLNYTILTHNLSSDRSRKIRTELRQGVVPEGLAPEVYHYIKSKGLYTSLDDS